MSKKQFKMPHSYVIIFILLIFVSVLTYVIDKQMDYDEMKAMPKIFF